MFREILQSQQPTVYQTLTNSLKDNKLSHCYLFTGPKGTPKKETALLLAQSLVCEKGDAWACEQCATCRRIQEGNYADLIYIDGEGKPIRVELIEALKTRFEKTALEKNGHKIFIIDNCETLTLKSANSLLKFIEEPAGEMTGIFISSQPERLLPTIVSRCQTVSFRPLSQQQFHDVAREKGLDELTSHFVSRLIDSTDQIETVISSEPFTNALVSFEEFHRLFLDSRPEAVLYLQDRFSRLNKSDRNAARDTFRYFLDICLQFVSDCLDGYDSQDENYRQLMQKAKAGNLNYADYLKAIAETRDGFNMSANGLLLIDQMLYKLLEV
ncbi:MAG: DNA polymerase III subunit delta [Erysipelotrichaceae bacterium]|nr:DNA polymerase III subunit delta [Erysipelotrichaceae bacterium]